MGGERKMKKDRSDYGLVLFFTVFLVFLCVSISRSADLYVTPCEHETDPVDYVACWVPVDENGWYLAVGWYSDMVVPQSFWFERKPWMESLGVFWLFVWLPGDPNQIDVLYQGYEDEKIATCYCHGDPPDHDIFNDGFESGDLSNWSAVVGG